jgi:hypothetical protein
MDAQRHWENIYGKNAADAVSWLDRSNRCVGARKGMQDGGPRGRSL